MSNPTRWTPVLPGGRDTAADMRWHEEGDYVLFADYATLRAERDALAARVAECGANLAQAVDHAAAGWKHANDERTRADAIEYNLIEACKRNLSLTNRADAAERAAQALRAALFRWLPQVHDDQSGDDAMLLVGLDSDGLTTPGDDMRKAYMRAVSDADTAEERINRALHWLDRYDVGIDEAQTALDYIRDELEPAAALSESAVGGEGET
jgi:hypothetical protein